MNLKYHQNTVMKLNSNHKMDLLGKHELGYQSLSCWHAPKIQLAINCVLP